MHSLYSPSLLHHVYTHTYIHTQWNDVEISIEAHTLSLPPLHHHRHHSVTLYSTFSFSLSLFAFPRNFCDVVHMMPCLQHGVYVIICILPYSRVYGIYGMTWHILLWRISACLVDYITLHLICTRTWWLWWWLLEETGERNNMMVVPCTNFDVSKLPFCLSLSLCLTLSAFLPSYIYICVYVCDALLCKRKEWTRERERGESNSHLSGTQ